MNRPVHRLLSMAVASTLITGCAYTSLTDKNQQAKGAQNALVTSLGIKRIVVEKTQLEPAALSEIRDGYAELVGQFSERGLAQQLELRLADVEMLLAEERQVSIDAGTSGGTYQHAISAYQNILVKYPDEASKEAVLYQLSRAYDLQGEREQSVAVLNVLLELFPTSQHAPEAWFRQGEAFYGQAEYAKAANAYAQVLANSENNNFYAMAAYMQGWAYYKLEAYDKALTSFDSMLLASFSDETLQKQAVSTSVLPAHVLPAPVLPDMAQLSKGQQKLVKDSLRMMATLFSYRGNGEAIVDFYNVRGNQPHSYLVYNELAQQHLDNDRYLDAAEAYHAFASHFPAHPEAVAFYVKHIDAFILGEFPSEVLSAKAGFVDTFGATTGQYATLPDYVQQDARPYLHQYLRELAQTQHSFAQQLNTPTKRHTLTPTLRGLNEDALRKEASAAYAKAQGYYLAFIDMFPDDELVAQMQFNLAESYFESAQYENAITHYEAFAYTFSDHEKASDGAYSALLAFKALSEKTLSDEVANTSLQGLKAKQRQSQQRFIATFSRDSRVVPVVQTLMQETFDEAQFEQALSYSDWLLNPPSGTTGSINEQVRLSAFLVKAHSLFGLKHYVEAETAYAMLLADTQKWGIAKQDALTQTLTRNYAISMFKQAEAAVGQDDLSQAVTHLTRLMRNTPNIDIRVNAQYDAASYLMTLERFDEAQALLEDFEQRFPLHELTPTIEGKRLFVYENTEQWQAAANVLYDQYERNKSTDAGREALLQAAEYFELAGNRAASLPAYRTYAHAYPAPFDTVMEVRFIMSEFYKQSGEDAKRRFWLDKLIKGHDGAGDNATPRSQTLAAMSAMVFAEDAKYVFNRIKLTQPLKASLTKKRKALTQAVEAHNRVLSYKVREYATVANHQLGALYRQLANDLMASQRPSNLNALELEQYELLLEEQAYPFEEQAMQVYEVNAKRSWDGVYDEWVKASFAELSALMPNRYRKTEKVEALSVEAY